ncbi:MAG: 5'/3'-nucleotidase SurE [Pseudobutyrivibrio sp.]|nr:5'/3'-nucleotidase SurE [Pseudobutyrivibrio sp.]
MNILITNDDGINASGLFRLAQVAREFGQVWVVAPDSQRSAASHSITLRETIDIYPAPGFEAEGIKAFACSGTPGDCVRVGALSVMPQKPDLLLSGINYGYNAASDIQYSATCGAAFEGAFQGCHSIALSEGASDCHEVTDKYLREVIAELIHTDIKPGFIHNVNFPDCKLEDFKGILRERTVSSGMFFKDTYQHVETLDNGGKRYMVKGMYNENCEDLTDFHAIVNNYISIGVVNNVGVL